ncbi:MAG: phosphomannomutase/phosphoglucomutase [Pseudomonadales bacterium]
MSYPLATSFIAIVGLLAALVLIYVTIILWNNEDHRASIIDVTARQYTAFLNAEVLQLSHRLRTVARSPEVIEALESNNTALIQVLERRWQSVLDYALRVELVPKGRAEPDLTGDPPINFAALDMIKRAEAKEVVLPEAFQHAGGVIVHTASAVNNASGDVVGVIFATFSIALFTEPLQVFDATNGELIVEQQFPGGHPLELVTFGQPPASPVRQIRLGLNLDHWYVVFRPASHLGTSARTRWGRRDGDLISGIDLVIPAAIALASLVFALFLGYARLHRTLQKDAQTFLDYVRRALDGASRPLGEYQLDLFANLALLTRRHARKSLRVRDDTTTPRLGPRARENVKQWEVDTGIVVEEQREDDDVLDVETVDEDTEVSANTPVEDLDPTIFRAYDIRGIVGKNLGENTVYHIGRAIGSEAQARGQGSLVVGCDGRNSSDQLRSAVIRGLMDTGCKVYDVGLVPTPVLYYATHALDTQSGVMVTGSHNPPEYNGLKIVLAGDTLADEAIQSLRRRVLTNELEEGTGSVERVDMLDHYVDRIASDIALAQPLKVVIDCGNGVAGIVAPRLIEALGCQVVPLYCDVDGNFPNHHPDPMVPENLADLIAAVHSEGADLGIAFDGDGDRLGVVTNRGDIVWPDRLLMLFSRDIVGRNPGADVVYDVKCSKHLNAFISEYGGRPIMWKTGHSHIKAKMKETGALLGGEFSGHICFLERWYGFDDAIYSAARLLEILGTESASADEIFEAFPQAVSTPEIKVAVSEETKFKIIESLEKNGDFGDGSLTTIDGIRVDYADGWGLVRSSNTSAVLTLRFEADTQEALERIQEIFRSQLRQVDRSLEF